MIVLYDNSQDILTQNDQRSDLWTICLLIYISPSLVKEIGPVKTQCYKQFVPKQFAHPLYFNKNSNYWEFKIQEFKFKKTH